MHPLDIVIKKRDGGELSRAEIEGFVRAVVRSGEAKVSGASLGAGETVTDAQIASFLMAVFQRGLSARELAHLTQAMRFSGETFDASDLDTFTMDKHSTGGVGDKTSLLIAPIVAAAGIQKQIPFGNDSKKGNNEQQIPFGNDSKKDNNEQQIPFGNGNKKGSGEQQVPFGNDSKKDNNEQQIPFGNDSKRSISVPMISGRSLGHTGGTLDKLETIPGFDTQLSMGRMKEVLRECHAALVGQTPRLVPADRILYALRDHTGTVESPFLITASIMSKKLAEDLRGLVLDVKVGSGAFMPTYEASRYLAELMVATGERAGTRTVALLTSMDEPLGRFSGNWVEVWECVDVMRGVRHPMSADMVELSCVLSGWMLYLAGAVSSPEDGAARADELLRDGSAYEAWLRLVRAQGGDVRVFEDAKAFHQPAASAVMRASRSGYLAGMDCKQVGWAVQRLGAGRSKPGDPVSAHAGIEVHAKIGDWVEAGQPVFTLFSEDEALIAEPLGMLDQTVRIEDRAPDRMPLVREVVQAGAVR